MRWYWSVICGVAAVNAGVGSLHAAEVPIPPAVEQDIVLGDSVVGAIVTTNEVIALDFFAVRDTVLDVTVQAEKGSALVPGVELSGETAGPIDLGESVIVKGSKVQIKKLSLPATDNYRLRIGSESGTGGFTAKTKGKVPSKYTLTGNVPASPTFQFDVPPGSTIKGQVKADKGSTLEPVIASLEDADGALTLTDNTAKGKTAKFKSATSEGGGTLTLTVGAGNATSGNYTAKMNVKAPKSKEQYDLSDTARTMLVAQPVATPPADAAAFDGIEGIEVIVSTAPGKGSTGFSYANEFNMTGTRDGLGDFAVDLRAAYDAENLYMRLRWTDPSATNDLHRRRWYFNGGDATAVPDWNSQFGAVTTENPKATAEAVPLGWSSNLNDDKFAIAWAIGDPAGVQTNGEGNAAGLPAGTSFAEAGCAVACHVTLGMSPPIGLVDLWHWKTSRSNPLGYVNDQWGGNGTARTTDTDQAIENRNRVSDNFSGPTKVLDPEAENVTVDKTAGTATIAFTGASGTFDLDGRTFLTAESSMDIESTDAVGGQAIYAARCQTCHGEDGRGSGKNLAIVGLTWTRAEMVTTIEAHAGITLDEGATAENAYSTDDTDRLIARVRAFTGIPGYWLTEPVNTDDIVKVTNFQTVYDEASGQYTVIVQRKLATADAGQDVQFDPSLGQAYLFGLAVMDFDGQNHAGNPLLRLVFQPESSNQN